MGTRASNGGCSDAMTLPISDWLFHLEGGTIQPYCALQFLPFLSIRLSCQLNIATEQLFCRCMITNKEGSVYCKHSQKEFLSNLV